MFEECNSLVELNKARADAVKQHLNNIEVNRNYNRRRREIMSAVKTYKVLVRHDGIPKSPVLYNGCGYAGESSIPNTIIISEEGVFA